MISDDLEKIKKLLKKNIPIQTIALGKMIRSKIGLLLLNTQNITPNSEHLEFLAGIELIHTASLFHDDVLDDNYKRRNHPNTKATLGNQSSILYGNIIMTNALRLIINNQNKSLTEMAIDTIKAMCEGELMQKSQTDRIPKIEEYIEKCRLKTASLFKYLIEGLTIISDTNPELVDFGENFGIAFQIKNDLENILTDKSDINNGIYTAPVIFAGNTDISKNAIEKTNCLIDNYLRRAILSLNNTDESIYKKSLIEVVECLRK